MTQLDQTWMVMFKRRAWLGDYWQMRKIAEREMFRHRKRYNVIVDLYPIRLAHFLDRGGRLNGLRLEDCKVTDLREGS